MLRFVLSAMALAGILATPPPDCADSDRHGNDHAQVTTAAIAPPAPAASGGLLPSAAPEPDGHDTEIIPVESGWG